MQQPPDATPPAPSQSNTTVIVVAVIAVVAVPVIIAVLGAFAAFGIYGTRRYLVNAKEAEGRSTVGAIARGALVSAEAAGTGLPASAPAVPTSLSQISARKYLSSPSDWNDPAWKELKFEMTAPQYFQYSWQRSNATQGVARAVADFDGNGVPDVTFEVPINCTGTPPVCVSSPSILEKR